MKSRLFFGAISLIFWCVNSVSVFAQNKDLPEVSIEALPFTEGFMFDGTWDIKHPPDHILDGKFSEIATATFEKPNSQGFRIKIDLKEIVLGEDQELFFVIMNLDEQIVEEMDARNYVGSEFWSKTVSGNLVAVVAYSNFASPPLGDIEYLHIPISGDLGLEGQIGDDERRHVNEYLRENSNTRLAKTVAKIENSVAKIVNGSLACSGFRVSKIHFLTNAHCFKTSAQCKNVRIKLGFEKPAQGKHWTLFEGTVVPVKKSSESLGCTSLQLSSSHDLAVITVDRVLDEIKWPIVEFASSMPSAGSLISIQHPSGFRKHITVEECSILMERVRFRSEMGNKAFAHSCDTNTGSSGSPIFNIQGKVVGLHFGGNSKLNVAVRVDHLRSKLRDLKVL